MIYIIWTFSALIAALLIVIFTKAAALRPKASDSGLTQAWQLSDEGAISRFQAILRAKTVWPRDGKIDFEEFERFLPLLKSLYPEFFEQIEIKLINRYGIVLRWAGKQPEEQPIVLMAHYDVVSAEAEEWKYPPFEAQVHDGAVWARGSVDTKCILSALLETSDRLYKTGFKPKRDILYVFTNNEETGGDTTPKVVQWLREQSIVPWLVLDEGGAVVSDGLPLGVKKEFALIGVAEKGIADLVLTASGEGGHSSIPSDKDSTAKLIDALHRIRTHPNKAWLNPVLKDMFANLAAYASLGYRLVFANLWLFTPVVKKIMSAENEGNAMLRTTVAVTQLNGSDTINTLPKNASAGLSVRILSNDTVDKAVERIKKLVGPDIKVDVAYSVEPSPISDFHSEAFSVIADTVRTVYLGAEVSPFIMSGGTDSKHFASVCSNVYRFGGFALSLEERQSIHAANEKLSTSTYLRGIEFYIQLIRAFNCDAQ